MKELTENEEMFEIERNYLLAQTDFVVNVVREFQAQSKEIPEKYIALMEYRQELRDLPEQPGFNIEDPDSYEWPVYPKC